LVHAQAAQQRRRPYQLTGAGATALRRYLLHARSVADTGLGRLAAAT
jgi:hypothetical protein